MLFATIITLASLSAGVQAAVGRYPCSVRDINGALVPYQSICDNLNSGPIGGECVEFAPTGEYFCGFAGAFCTTTSVCDGGVCNLSRRACTGDLGAICYPNTGFGNYCLGNIPCSIDETGGQVGQCGANNSPCGQECTYNPEADTDDLECTTGVFDELCSDAQCNSETLQCGTSSPSQRARRQRRKLDDLCPQGMSACSLDTLGGYECVDFDSSLENCGGCVAAGSGADCSAVEGAVGIECVAGQCVASSCDSGYTLSARGTCTDHNNGHLYKYSTRALFR